MLTIRTLRQARGWSQSELARRVGVHPQAVYLWEHGRRTPQVAHMRKLGGVFEMCSDQIELASGDQPTAGLSGESQSTFGVGKE